MNQENPKIDIETLRIESRDDDLSGGACYKTYQSFIYTLKDDKRIFAHGSLKSVNEFLGKIFGLPRLEEREAQGTIYLKDRLIEFYSCLVNMGQNPSEKPCFYSFQPLYTIHYPGWEFVNLK